MSDIATFDEQAEYLIMDDIPFNYMPNKKQWWGAQLEFTATDKYHRKKQIKFGRPLIYICNPDEHPRRTPFWNEWFRDNCVEIDIWTSLFSQ